VEFMEQETARPREARRPFCIYLSHRTAHPPCRAPADIAGMYDREEVPLPPGVDSWFSRTNGNVFQGIMMGSYENQYRRYCETLTAMDRDIGRLLEQVDRLGLRENTLILYAGDNGMMWGEHRRHGIKYPNEACLRLPFMVRCPWLIPDPGSRRSQMVLNIDIAPTLLRTAGIAGTLPGWRGKASCPSSEIRTPRDAGPFFWSTGSTTPRISRATPG
jgi:N-acetylglucosamine-6-sulfatase